MAVTDLTGTKWLFNSEIDLTGSVDYKISFNCDGVNYILLGLGLLDELSYWDSSNEQNIVYQGKKAWLSEAFRTIEITGGTDATNSDLIAWLQANATQITDLTAGETYKIRESPEDANFNITGSFTFGDEEVDQIRTGHISSQIFLYFYKNGSPVYVCSYYFIDEVWKEVSAEYPLGDLTNPLTVQANLEVPETFLNVFEKVSSPEPSNIFSIGNLPIDNIYFGELPVMKVYLGDILIYEAKPVVEDSNFLLNNGDYLYCSDGDIFDTRVVTVETASGEVITTWSGENIQVYDE